MSRAEAELRLASQATEGKFRAAADVVFENDADRDRIRERVRAEWDRVRG
jgi:dephospho-CoA kinase